MKCLNYKINKQLKWLYKEEPKNKKKNYLMFLILVNKNLNLK